jgi:hypothetical protein
MVLIAQPNGEGGVMSGPGRIVRFVPPLIRCYTRFANMYSVPLFLKRQCDRTLGDEGVGGTRYPRRAHRLGPRSGPPGGG